MGRLKRKIILKIIACVIPPLLVIIVPVAIVVLLANLDIIETDAYASDFTRI